MEYVTYILIVLGLLALCIRLIPKRDSADRSPGRRTAANVKSDRQAVPEPGLTGRVDVPTPWGWPGNHSRTSTAEELSVSEALQRFVDHLVAEKQTVENSEYLLRKNESLRSMIEGRYRVPGSAPNGSSRKPSTDPSDGPVGGPIVFDRSRLREVRTPWGW